MSHTVTIEIEMRDRTAAMAAITAMGGTVLGVGTHKMFYGNNEETGLGFKLPGWTFPLVLRDNNTLAFDDYHGRWGNVTDIETLKGHYSIAAGRQAASEHGWHSELQSNGSLLIYHPSGATITVTAAGVVDANGFVGAGCNVASAIENAIGTTQIREDKAEMFAERVICRPA